MSSCNLFRSSRGERSGSRLSRVWGSARMLLTTTDLSTVLSSCHIMTKPSTESLTPNTSRPASRAATPTRLVQSVPAPLQLGLATLVWPTRWRWLTVRWLQ